MEELRVPINKLIFEKLEDVLQSEIRKLAKDIANTLDVDPKLLINELMKEKVLVYLIEEGSQDIDDMNCKSFDKKGNVYIPCDEPVIFKKNYCIQHMNHRILKEQIPKDTLELSTLMYKNTKYYIDPKNNNRVLDSLFKPIGYFLDNTIYELVISSEDSAE